VASSSHGRRCGSRSSPRGAFEQHLRKLWVEECGYSILEGQDDYNAAGQVESERLRHLEVRELRPLVADPEALISRFHERDLDSPVTLVQKQRDFINAFNEFVSKAIQLDYRKLKFRRDVLGDSTLSFSHEEATRLIRSAAVQLLSLDFFTDTKSPVVGHTARRMPVEGHHLAQYGRPVIFALEITCNRVSSPPLPR
jgi:uncharacterized protein (DUF2384 family)